MRKRYQNGRVVKSTDGRYWVGKWLEDGKDRSRILGKFGEMTKSKACDEMSKIVAPVNAGSTVNLSPEITVRNFVEGVFLPFYRRKWKRITNESRTTSIMRHIVGEFGSRKLCSITRQEMQRFLDDRKHLAASMVDHLRWDLKQILDLAIAEGIITKNPAYVPPGTMLLFVPRECRPPSRPVMTMDEAKTAFNAVDLRERVVLKLAVIAGMRCSEIFGLRRGRVKNGHVEIVERVCRRDIDTPKTEKSVREAAVSRSLQEDLTLWLDSSQDTGPDGWLFPSEQLTMPIGADNLMMRNIRPRLKAVGLGWVDYRVMRRTHSSLMNERGVSPKVIADQQGHTVDVNLNVYTRSSIEARTEALETLESAFLN